MVNVSTTAIRGEIVVVGQRLGVVLVLMTFEVVVVVVASQLCQPDLGELDLVVWWSWGEEVGGRG